MHWLLLVISVVTLDAGRTAEISTSLLENDIPNLSSDLSLDTHKVRETKNFHRNKLVEVRHFYLWTRKSNANKTEVINPTVAGSIVNSTFTAKKTFIIIHGFLGFGNEQWILHLGQKLLHLFDCNVISVDWPAGNTVLDYYTVVGRVSYVAEDVTFLMEKLKQIKKLNMKHVHAIGHSLGAHIAGLSAKPIWDRYGRITGLDPAGLKYHNVPPTERLDRGDADYVDVMHTNGCKTFWNPWLSCYGINENLGHTDFWPNGGKHQPRCQDGKVKGDIGCDHMIAYTYFLESLEYDIDDTFFLSRNCTSWDDYTSGNCSCSEDGAQYMGFNSNPKMPGVFYLKTNSSSPYAERDAVCAPGKTVSDNSWMIMIASYSGSGILFLLVIVIATVLVSRRKSRTLDSGLLIEDDDESMLGQEGNSTSQPDYTGLEPDSEDSLTASDVPGSMPASHEDDGNLVF